MALPALTAVSVMGGAISYKSDERHLSGFKNAPTLGSSCFTPRNAPTETFSLFAQSCRGRGHWGPGREATHPDWPCSVAAMLNRLHGPLPQTRMASPPPGQGSAEPRLGGEEPRLGGELPRFGLRSGKRILGEGGMETAHHPEGEEGRSWVWQEESLGSGALPGFKVMAPL